MKLNQWKIDLVIMPTKAKSIKYIQSCLVSVSFPETLDGVLNMVKGNKFIADWSTDLELLLNFKNGDPVFWTAPKWMTEGDIIFFYHTKRAKTRTARLLAEALQKFPRKRNLIKLLKRAKATADLYSGKIFGYASVSGATQMFGKQEKHFVSRLFAPLKEVRIFEEPLPQEMFADCVKIGLSTTTPLFKKEFNGIRKLLSKGNEMPSLIQNVSLGDKVFRNINVSNWRSISCRPNTKFIHEGQLRAYLIDFFLNEVKDKGTPLLEECECFRGTRKTGRADYFVKIHGQWIPAEVKLDISKEKNLFDQTAKYMNIDFFSPGKGSHRNRIFKATSEVVCLVLDRFGIYFIGADGEFLKSGFDKPHWRREQFTKDVALKIRKEVKKHTPD
jgi:hypothetical protein